MITLLSHHALIARLVTRDVAGRYRGSLLGMLWSFLTPLLMLLVYTFVFSVVFAARWAGGDGSKTHFALMLFAGMAVFSLFAEVLNRAPMLIVQHANYVKKVVFPIHVLPVVAIGSAAFHALAAFLLLLVAIGFEQGVQLTWIALPLVLLPLLVLLLGLAWLLAALGTYLRDIGQMVTMATVALQFLSPVFYPLSALPASFQMAMRFNPVTLPIESVRRVLLEGVWPDWSALAIYSLIAVLLAALGSWFFDRVRSGFADVL